jgi:hypothetical protein
VLKTRSFWTVIRTWLAGISPPSGSAGPFGVQSMKYSAIRDCGSEAQRVSFPSTDSGPESETVATARFFASTSRSVTDPAFTPATRTSEPLTIPNALYISIR